MTTSRGPAPARSTFMRGIWFGLGWLAVAVGGIGVVVPGLPTTGFMILAAACFARCSPRFEQWVLDLPGIGKAVADYRSGLGMPKRAKVMAISMMTVAITISAGLVVGHLAVRIAIVAAGVVGAWYITQRVPTAPTVRVTAPTASSIGTDDRVRPDESVRPVLDGLTLGRITRASRGRRLRR